MNVSTNASSLDRTESESVTEIKQNFDLNEDRSDTVKQANENNDSIDCLTAIELLQLLKEYKKREFLYVSQLATLQHELHRIRNASQAALITEVTSVPAPFEVSPAVYHDMSSVVHTALIDPTVNLEIRELRLKLHEQALELQKTKEELKISTFSADSVMCRRLINKCKALQTENIDIGKMLLETNLKPFQIQVQVLQKQLVFFKQQIKNMYSMICDLEEDNEKLVNQLQDQTLQRKREEKEKETLLVTVQKLEEKYDELEKRYNKIRHSSPDRNKSEKQRVLESKTTFHSPSSERKMFDEKIKKVQVDKKTGYHSCSPSSTKHRHRRFSESSTTRHIDSHGKEQKESQTSRSNRHASTTYSKYATREDRQRRRRDSDSFRGERRRHSIQKNY